MKHYFNKISRHHGGLLKYNHFQKETIHAYEAMLDFFQSFIEDMPESCFHNVYCNWVENPSFNAFATKHEGYEFVAIYVGVFNRLFRYIHTFLADSEVLNSLGDPTVETSNPGIIASLKNLDQADLVSPIDPIRHDAAQYLTWNALMFVFYHELAHIDRCHLRLLSERFGLDEYVELPISSLTPEESELRLILEVDADVYAANVSWMTWSSSWVKNEIYPGIINWDTYQSWAYSIVLCFYIMDAHSTSSSNSSNPSHPTAMARIWNLINLSELFSPSDNKELMAIRLLDAMIEIEPWWSKNSIPISSNHRINHNFTRAEVAKLSHELGKSYYEIITHYQLERRAALSSNSQGK